MSFRLVEEKRWCVQTNRSYTNLKRIYNKPTDAVSTRGSKRSAKLRPKMNVASSKALDRLLNVAAQARPGANHGNDRKYARRMGKPIDDQKEAMAQQLSSRASGKSRSLAEGSTGGSEADRNLVPAGQSLRSTLARKQKDGEIEKFKRAFLYHKKVNQCLPPEMRRPSGLPDDIVAILENETGEVDEVEAEVKARKRSLKEEIEKGIVERMDFLDKMGAIASEGVGMAKDRQRRERQIKAELVGLFGELRLIEKQAEISAGDPRDQSEDERNSSGILMK